MKKGDRFVTVSVLIVYYLATNGPTKAHSKYLDKVIFRACAERKVIEITVKQSFGFIFLISQSLIASSYSQLAARMGFIG